MIGDVLSLALALASSFRSPLRPVWMDDDGGGSEWESRIVRGFSEHVLYADGALLIWKFLICRPGPRDMGRRAVVGDRLSLARTWAPSSGPRWMERNG